MTEKKNEAQALEFIGLMHAVVRGCQGPGQSLEWFRLSELVKQIMTILDCRHNGSGSAVEGALKYRGSLNGLIYKYRDELEERYKYD